MHTMITSLTPLFKSLSKVSFPSFASQRWVSLFCLFVAMLASSGVCGQSQTFNPGSYNFTVPAGVTTLTIKAWGGGGAGLRATGGRGGGGGGAYTQATVTVTLGSNISITVGSGGIASTVQRNGGATIVSGSSFTTITANGGNGASVSSGPYPGGNGGTAINTNPGATNSNGGKGGNGLDGDSGGGGGQAGCPAGNGTNGQNGLTGGTGGFYEGGVGGGMNGYSTNTTNLSTGPCTTAGAGGAGGGDENQGFPTTGFSGTSPGGGGGGCGDPNGSTTTASAGSGASGRVILEWTCNPTITLTSATGTDNQSIYSDCGMTNITYAIGGTATGATVTGLPTGITGSYSNGVFTISGSSTQLGTFNYMLTTTTANCTNTSTTGSITVTPAYYDFGDLLNTYPQARAVVPGGHTAGTPNGTGAVWAGILVDTEASQNFSAAADGDDNTGLDDEDGLALPAGPLDKGSSYAFTVNVRGNTSNDKYYGLWFDWNGDGDFTDVGTDAFYTNAVAITGTNVDAIVSVMVPSDATANYAVRLIVSDVVIDSGDYGASCINGEVEDYMTPVALPIELLDFTATVVANERVLLKWSTASEKDNAYFSIQRSRDGVHWAQIGQEKGAGNSASVLNYFHWDKEALERLNYYRLQQFDLDGKSSFSPIRVAYLEEKGMTVSLYSNPTSDRVQLQINSQKTERWNIRVYNSIGQAVAAPVQKVADGSYELDVQSLQHGPYFLVVTNGNGSQHQVLSFFKQ